MSAWIEPIAPAMASRWRRRRMCLLIGERPAPAALIEVSGRGARLATTLCPAPGARVALHHPEAGAIAASVIGGDASDLRLAFDEGAASVAFALAAVTADMSRAD